MSPWMSPGCPPGSPTAGRWHWSGGLLGRRDRSRGALYWLGRGLRGAGDRRRRLAERPGVLRAEALVRRFGAPAVALSFLTVGVQSAVNAAAGLLRMPARRYLPGLLVGAALWATVYTTVGFAVLYAVLGRASWWWLAAGAAGVLLVVVGTWRTRRREDRLLPSSHQMDIPSDK
ncbi:MAG: VTT domain-containing protein [Nocardioides sp.]